LVRQGVVSAGLRANRICPASAAADNRQGEQDGDWANRPTPSRRTTIDGNPSCDGVAIGAALV